jgi:predicted SAM-dependent methyltransferase
MKLNVGCGRKKLHGYVNVDIRPELEPDAVCDVSKIHEKFTDVDLIYSCHVLEHFPLRPSTMFPVTWKEVLDSWTSSLKPGGTLRISVPDMKSVIDHFTETGDISAVYSLIWGGQKYDYDFHFHGWTFETLKRDLESAGYENIVRYDWRNTDHYYVDDYSQAYLPHMDKQNGRLMSLNVEARKRSRKD